MLLTDGFQKRLRSTRKALGLSMRDLARRCNISQPTITMHELGRSYPDLPGCEKYATALGVNVCWLAYGKGRKQSIAPSAPPTISQQGVSP